jgi:hypothetical protein
MKKLITLIASIAILTSCSSDDATTITKYESMYPTPVTDKYQILISGDKSMENTMLIIDGKDTYSGCGGATVEDWKTIEIISDLKEDEHAELNVYQNGKITQQELLHGSSQVKQGTFEAKHCFKANENVTYTNGKLLVTDEGDKTIIEKR